MVCAGRNLTTAEEAKAAMKALLIIDVQQGMFSAPGMEPYDGEGVVGRLAALLARARADGLPVFFVQHKGAEPGHPLAEDGPGFPFRAELTPLAHETVIVKRQCGAFHDTNLEERLRAQDIRHLVVGGMMSQYCVDTAVRSAFERGYEVTLVEDGHTCFDTTELTADQIVVHENRTLANGFATLAPAAYALD
jgi:nicotinamidase-related amidase